MLATSSNEYATRLKNLPQRTYGLRVLGMGLAGLSVGTAMWELKSPLSHWLWMFLTCFAWPHIAYFRACRSSNPLRSELQNFVFDSFVAASWVPLMHFNALPTAVLMAVAMSDKIKTGGRGLLLRSLPRMFVALIFARVLSGFSFQPQTSMLVLLATLPILIIHTIAVSMSSYHLVRKVQQQNLKLEQLSRIDTLTGLVSRGHWQTLAENLLQQHRNNGLHVAVMLLDVDQFKAINDRHGHAVGDDVLRGIAELIEGYLPANSSAGRLGGDEFAVVLPVQLPEAEVIAEKIRCAVENVNFNHAPELQCSISIGIAQPGNELGLREWLELADRALYRAKNAGRNRTASLVSSKKEATAAS